jgi:hypothetical protein
MAFQLIPFPISIIFGLVFCLAFVAVLWKLRRSGKIYNTLYRAGTAVAMLLFLLIIFSLIT